MGGHPIREQKKNVNSPYKHSKIQNPKILKNSRLFNFGQKIAPRAKNWKYFYLFIYISTNPTIYQSIYISLEDKLPYDPSFPSAGKLVGQLTCHNFLKGQEVTLSMLVSYKVQNAVQSKPALPPVDGV